MSYLIPSNTGIALFDVWSLAHLGFWLFVGSTCWALQTPRTETLVLCLGVAYLWEVFERWAEIRYPWLWRNPESWLNGWVSDPLMCIMGCLIMWWLLDRWG